MEFANVRRRHHPVRIVTGRMDSGGKKKLYLNGAGARHDELQRCVGAVAAACGGGWWWVVVVGVVGGGGGGGPKRQQTD